MKKILALVGVLWSGCAAAQQAQPPNIDQLQSQYLIETGQLRIALGQAQLTVDALKKEIESLRKPQEQKPEAKK